jgi:hypothetical protein
LIRGGFGRSDRSALKKELIGNFKNSGAVWCLEPEEVNVYDFLTDAECRAPRTASTR